MNRVMEDAGAAAGTGSHGELEAIPVLLAQQVTLTGLFVPNDEPTTAAY
jgi:hypothetical protein